MGRIRYQTYDFDNRLNRTALEEDVKPFEELVDMYYRIQRDGFGCHVLEVRDDSNNVVYDSDDPEYDRFTSFAEDVLDT